MENELSKSSADALFTIYLNFDQQSLDLVHMIGTAALVLSAGSPLSTMTIENINFELDLCERFGEIIECVQSRERLLRASLKFLDYQTDAVH